jgi:alanyl-tRNA synthetase
VAKGIRRISAVTGKEAVETIARSLALSLEVQELEKDIQHWDGDSLLLLDDLERQLVSLR